MKKTSYSASIVLKQHLTGIVVALGLTFQTLPALAASGDVYYVHSDHLDTPRQLTNQQNEAVWTNTPLTEAFGTSAPDEDPGNTGTPFTFNLRFPGQYYDQETGTHYNYYRDHYFPGLGRYGQSDPIGLYGGINTYAYVGGSPLLWGDWYGLDPRAGIGKGRQFLCEAGGDANKAWERAVDLRIQRNWEALTPEGKELREAENYLWAYYAVENGQNHWYGTTAVASVYLGILIPGWQALRLIENSAGAQLQSPASFDAMLAGNLGVLDGAGSSLK